MSTKTTFKRVALVAVAALGLGVLSVAPSQADAISVTLTPSATATTIATTETATITIAAAAVAGATTDSLTVRAVVTSSNVATSGTLAFAGTTDSTTTRMTIGTTTASLDSATVAIGQLIRGSVKLNLVTPSAKGTYTVYVYTTSGTAGSLKTAADQAFTWTVTVTAPSTAPDSSSTSIIGAGQTSVQTVDAVVTASKDASAQVATIKVTQKNSTSSANEALVVTVAGPGYISDNTADSTTAGSKVRNLITAAGPGAGVSSYVKVFADGTSGVSTITITSATTGLVLGTEKVTFSDTAPSTIAVVVKKAYIAAGATTSKVFAVTVKDSSGNAITGTSVAVTGTRTDTTTAGKALATADLSCAWDSTDLVYYCSATGASSIKFGPAGYLITATGTDAAATAVSAAAVTTTYADTVATKVTVTAPATANVGDKITYTLTATEKNGYPIADQTYEGGTANGSTGGIFWNTTTVPAYTGSVTAFNSGETITTVSGVATKSVYVPAVAGSLSATWTLAGKSTAAAGAIDLSIAGTTITATTVVTNPGVDAATDAANEATDAANAATDAALAAADAADAATAAAQDASDAVAALSATVATLVASLKAQITSLTNLVIKIQKKVKA